MMSGRRTSRAWPVVGVIAVVAVVAAMLSIWLVVWRAPRDLPINATQFWIDYVTPRALVVFGVVAPLMALMTTGVWLARFRRHRQQRH